MQRIIGWVFGIIGALAVFCGLFILFAGENQYLASWRAGDIAHGWAFGLLAGGGLLLLVVLGLILSGRSRRA
jgi:hypothetical protein